MSSTFTTSNRFNLQATGDNPTTWGAVLNANVFTIMDEALDGVTTIDISIPSSVTLSTANGTTDEARKRTLVLTGAASAAKTIIVPALNKFYLVKCAYTGAYTTTVKTSSDAGVVLQSGDTAILYVTPSGVSVIYQKSLHLVAGNNLADVPDKVAARASLGLGNPTINSFVNNGSTTVRTLTQDPGTINAIIVVFDGVVQKPTTDYTLSGTTLTYTAAPPANTVEVIFVGNASLPAGVPTDGSVTTVKIASSALATNAEATAGSDNTKLMTPLRVKESIVANAPASPFTAYYESTPQSFTEGVAVTVSHGLGVVPKIFQAYLVCQTAEGGYSVGDYLDIQTMFNQGVLSSGSYQMGVALTASTSTLSFVYYSAVSAFDNMLPRKDTGAPFTMTFSSWKVAFRAFK